MTAALEDLGLPLNAGMGDRVVLVAEGDGEGVVVERLGAGRLIVDLTGPDLDVSELTRVDVALGAGEVEIVVPDDVRFVGRARVEVGQYEVRGTGPWRSHGGIAVDETVDVGPAEATEIVADLRVGAGQITVRDVPSTTEEQP